jgi:hypothetical protein
VESTCRPCLPTQMFSRISSRIVAIRIVEGFGPIILFTGTVLLPLFSLVLAASSTNHDAFAVVATVTDRIEPRLHSSNLNVLHQVLPASVSAKRTHMMLIVILGAKYIL